MSASPRTEIKTTTCYMCACRCGIRVHLREGEVRYIDGNPAHPLNRGVICAKGSSGIMKQYSPARLTRPLLRREGAERGAADFVEIGWDDALALIEQRLARIRAEDPKKFALFTGRDQMQALTGLFARQFGTPNYAAHGGFCSVNMAAGMIYTIGGSFWEFGGPDLERARLFVMIGTAEDHHSNPLKIAISEFKRSGGRFVSINPVRTGYSAIADEWVPIRPGTDGALLLAFVHEILHTGLYDREFLARYTNAGYLIDCATDSERHGLPVRDASHPEAASEYAQNALWWDRHGDRPVPAHRVDADPFLAGEFKLPDGTPVKPAFQLLMDRVKDYTPEWAAGITGVPADTIRRLAHEMGVTARDQKIELPIAWTDSWGTEHEKVTGNPVAFHAMRGLAAHSNGFHAIRTLATRGASLRRNARLRQRSTLQTATGMKHPRIAQTAQGAMGGSFNTREFFHGVERARLRALKLGFIGAAFVIPMLAFGAFARHAGVELAVVGFVIQYAGLLAERWYFFAEARHPQNLFYQTIS